LDRRAEPRLTTETAASLRVLRPVGEFEFKCLIADVSGVGYRLLMHDALEPGETIQLQLNGAHVIATVRYCKLNGDRFLIGVERVDEWFVEPGIATEPAPPSNAGADGSPRALGRPKVNYLNRLTAVAIRQLFADSFKKGERRSPKIAGIALATVAALLIALLGLYYDRGLVRARGNSASPASSSAKDHRERDPANQPDANHQPPSAQAPSETQSSSARQRVQP
jgi:PilZ domain-containing protein